MDYLDTRHFDRLSDEEVLDRIGTLLAIAIGRNEEQRRLNALAGSPPAKSSRGCARRRPVPRRGP